MPSIMEEGGGDEKIKNFKFSIFLQYLICFIKNYVAGSFSNHNLCFLGMGD